MPRMIFAVAAVVALTGGAAAQEPYSAPTPDEAMHATPGEPAASQAAPETTAAPASQNKASASQNEAASDAKPASETKPASVGTNAQPTDAGQTADAAKPAAAAKSGTGPTANQETYKMKDGGMYQPPAQRPASPAKDLDYGRT